SRASVTCGRKRQRSASNPKGCSAPRSASKSAASDAGVSCAVRHSTREPRSTSTPSKSISIAEPRKLAAAASTSGRCVSRTCPRKKSVTCRFSGGTGRPPLRRARAAVCAATRCRSASEGHKAKKSRRLRRASGIRPVRIHCVQIQALELVERSLHALAAHRLAVACERLERRPDLYFIVRPPSPREPDRPHRLARGRARRPSDACNGDRHLAAQGLQRANRHFPSRVLAHRAVTGERRCVHPEQRLLERIAIRDYAAKIPVRAAGRVGQHFADPAARAGFGGDQPRLLIAQLRADALRKTNKPPVVHAHGLGNL